MVRFSLQTPCSMTHFAGRHSHLRLIAGTCGLSLWAESTSGDRLIFQPSSDQFERSPQCQRELPPEAPPQDQSQQ